MFKISNFTDNDDVTVLKEFGLSLIHMTLPTIYSV